ncbi:MAG: 50S ribosomal protein L9, partial [Holosporales bacterium]|nr:50S ribosomal protein L9 [Holosporales bacterium]
MQVILVERVGKLGGIGDVIEVKRGYGRNFLLPKGKALRATKDNLDYLKTKKSELEATNLQQKAEAEIVALKMNDVSITIIRQASESGYLFGSVRSNDIVLAISKHGFCITKSQVQID